MRKKTFQIQNQVLLYILEGSKKHRLPIEVWSLLCLLDLLHCVGGGRDTVREIQSNDEVCGSYPRA